MADESVVKYVGSSTRRFVTKNEWERAGVEGQDTVEWNAQNEFSVPTNALSADAMKVLSKDAGFKVPRNPTPPDAAEVDSQDKAPKVVDEAPTPEKKTTR